jgi:very-short-patch-repair endonuclease
VGSGKGDATLSLVRCAMAPAEGTGAADAHNTTAAEQVLWDGLRGGRVAGMKFQRQHAIGRFVVDFYAAKARLVVEVDGDIHDSRKPEDAARDSCLHSQGLRVLRVRNDDVLTRLPWVLQSIARLCASGEARSE